MSDQARGGWLSPLLQKRRIEAALPHIRGSVLDYGCGNGALYDWLGDTERAGYAGFDIDPGIVSLASERWPGATFVSDLAVLNGRKFDTIVSLAVIEHVPSVGGYLHALRSMLRPGGAIVLTSPHPAFDSVHRFGARVGLFSWEASEEHNEYVTAASMRTYCEEFGLGLAASRRFLLGANQLFVLKGA